ncbi:V-type ATPase, G subunit [Emergomyces pasteurianus Ep9510]|uniref:V-type proton ATPase subunit G n=1 Tax=Emergomyces pasteurianus Ep9510 TaxID=1447872 RepID=A0A1J9QGX2_9EURO|nr:V-type ATPase, G subunit [Emergomyces pasteurianus Ep9510]
MNALNLNLPPLLVFHKRRGHLGHSKNCSTNAVYFLIPAREYRTKRVKDARNEAQKEIEEYRQKKEEEFKKFEAEHSSGNKVAEEEANKEAEVKVQEIKDIGKKKGGQVVEDLIRTVTDVQPQIPKKLTSNS